MHLRFSIERGVLDGKHVGVKKAAVFSSLSDASNPTNKAFYCYLSCFFPVGIVARGNNIGNGYIFVLNTQYWRVDFFVKSIDRAQTSIKT